MPLALAKKTCNNSPKQKTLKDRKVTLFMEDNGEKQQEPEAKDSEKTGSDNSDTSEAESESPEQADSTEASPSGTEDEKILASLEKTAARLEVEEQRRADLTEHVSRLTEEIGELRAMNYDRDKAFSEFDETVSKIKEEFDLIKPERIRKEFEEKEKRILEIISRIEKLEAITLAQSRNLQAFYDKLAKIKSIENLLEVSGRLERDIHHIKETRTYIDKSAAKIEAIFTELNARLPEIISLSNKVSSTEDMAIDAEKSVDKMDIRLKETVIKDDLEKAKAEITKKQDSLRAAIEELDTKHNGIDEEVKKLAQAMQPIEKKLAALSETEKELMRIAQELNDPKTKGKLKEELEKARNELNGKIEELQRSQQLLSAKLEQAAAHPERDQHPAPSFTPSAPQSSHYPAQSEGTFQPVTEAERRPVTIPHPGASQPSESDPADMLSGILRNVHRAMLSQDYDTAQAYYAAAMEVYEECRNRGSDNAKLIAAYRELQQIYAALSNFK